MFYLRHCFVVILAFIAGCSINADVVLEGVHEDGIEAGVYFCPRDSCENILLKSINDAQNSVHCAFFELDLGSLISALAEKSHSADVKVVIDEGNYESQIKGDGVKAANSVQYMHNKFCIIDGSLVLTGSTNPTSNGVNFNNNNLIMISSGYIAENYEDEFSELWDGIYAAGDKVRYGKISSQNMEIENYFCPEDNCKEQVISEIKKAKHNIYFMTFSFTDGDIADAMLFRNVDIKGVFENRGSGTEYSQYGRLKDFGIDVRKDTNPKTMHHKVFIIDNETVITGSFNPTGSGNYRNDENILIIHNKEIADKFLEEFNILWG